MIHREEKAAPAFAISKMQISFMVCTSMHDKNTKSWLGDSLLRNDSFTEVLGDYLIPFFCLYKGRDSGKASGLGQHPDQ